MLAILWVVHNYVKLRNLGWAPHITRTARIGYVLEGGPELGRPTVLCVLLIMTLENTTNRQQSPPPPPTHMPYTLGPRLRLSLSVCVVEDRAARFALLVHDPLVSVSGPPRLQALRRHWPAARLQPPPQRHHHHEQSGGGAHPLHLTASPCRGAGTSTRLLQLGSQDQV